MNKLGQVGTIGGLLLIFTILGASAVMFSSLGYSTILPGFEGLDVKVEGMEINSRLYPVNTIPNLPSGYYWQNRDVRNAVLGADLDAWDTTGLVKFRTAQPQIINDPFSVGKTVNYWVDNHDGTYTHVSGEIITYIAHAEITALDAQTANPHTFTGEKVWFAMNATVWGNALQENSPVGGKGPSQMGHAWETYLMAVIQPDSGFTGKLGDHWYLDPSPTSGSQLTLYSEASQLLGNVNNLNATLAGDPRPDARMQPDAHFSISLTTFGETTSVLGDSNPVANYNIKVYALRLGTFTYTNKDDTPWATTQPPADSWTQFIIGLTSFFANPFTNATFWQWVIIAAAVVTVYLLVTTPLLSMMLKRGRRR